MRLPSAITIRPLTVPAHATLSIPGSKSLTNRALILAALGPNRVELRGALWSEDTEHMVNGLRSLGFSVEVATDPAHPDNRMVTVQGKNGIIPSSTAELFVGTAGTAARFLSAFCALGKGPYRLHGTERMHQRPMKEVFDAIRSLGADVQDASGCLPAVISGPLRSGTVKISDTDSSQFASAMLLISRAAHITVETSSSPYVEMTRRLLETWATPPSVFDIEPDASSASYFIALRHLHSKPPQSGIALQRWPVASLQIDHRMERFLPPPPSVSRKTDLGDSVLTLAVTAAAMKRAFHLREASNLRKQECDRIAALATELKKCGVPAQEFEDGLVLHPAPSFSRAIIGTHEDHRIAMSFAALGTVDVLGDGQSWITLENPSCVAKTFPNFFETLESMARQSYEAAGAVYRPMVRTTRGEPLR